MIDIENTLFYADVGKFLSCVHDVLKDNGTFFLADTRTAGAFESLEREIKKYFDIEVKEDMTTRI